MDDLTDVSLWDELFSQVKSGGWDVVILSPPCNTWSRARYQWKVHPGPKPLPSLSWPWGFPWLDEKSSEKVKEANMFVTNSIKLAKEMSEVGGYFLIEPPGGSGFSG